MARSDVPAGGDARQVLTTSVVLGDRRVIASGEHPPSLYALCRQWVQQQSDADLLASAHESDDPQLPPLAPRPPPTLPPAGPPPEAPAPRSGDTSAQPSMEDLLKHHKQHWKAVRQYHQQQAAASRERYLARLGKLLKEHM